MVEPPWATVQLCLKPSSHPATMGAYRARAHRRLFPNHIFFLPPNPIGLLVVCLPPSFVPSHIPPPLGELRLPHPICRMSLLDDESEMSRKSFSAVAVLDDSPNLYHSCFSDFSLPSSPSFSFAQTNHSSIFFQILNLAASFPDALC